MRLRARLICLSASTLLAAVGGLLACGSDDSSPGETTDSGSGSDVVNTSDSSSNDAGADAGFTPTLIAGGGNACLLRGAGMVCWGDNRYGTLGIGSADSNPHFSATAVPGITPTNATSGSHHLCAISNGQVYCWGFNGYGEVGHDPASDLDASTCLGSFACTKSPLALTGITSPTLVSGGSFHSCALQSDGTLSCWGDNRYGEVGLLTPDSGPFCSGGKCQPSPTAISGITGAARIAAGESFECTLGASTGGLAVTCLGSNASNQLGRTAFASGDLNPHPDPAAVDGITTAIQIAISFDTVCALMADHTVQCWGNDTRCELGKDPLDVPPSCGGDPCSVAPQTVAGISDVREVSGGDAFCAIKSDDSVWCWGPNNFGQLGHDPFTDDASSSYSSPTPRQVASLGPAAHVAVGDGFACALLKDNTVWCWGNNEMGQLGAMTNDVDGAPLQFTYTPVKVGGL